MNGKLWKRYAFQSLQRATISLGKRKANCYARIGAIALGVGILATLELKFAGIMRTLCCFSLIGLEFVVSLTRK